MKATSGSILSDFDLIERILKRGDASAYRMMVERHQDYAFTLALRILNNRHEAEEAAQDAFVNAFKALHNFEKNAKFTTWFYRIAINAALAVKAKRPPQHLEIENMGNILGGGHTMQTKAADQQKYLHQAIAQLPPDDAAVITLFYLKENSIEEIAEILAIEIGNVKVKLHRARKKMAIVLDELLGVEAKNLIG
jgi:RNA polymerase sigma factor (sigma-70 family)